MNQALITVNKNCTGKHWEQFRELDRVSGIITTRSQDEIDHVLNYLALKNGPGPAVRQ